MILHAQILQIPAVCKRILCRIIIQFVISKLLIYLTENLKLRVQEKCLKVIKEIENNFKTKVFIVSVVNQIFNIM